MKATTSTILALSITLAACGRGQDLQLDQTSTALGCGAPGEPPCARSDDTTEQHLDSYGDAGASHDGTRDCRGDGDCGYGEVCERRHGVSSCVVDSDNPGAVDASADAGSAPCDDGEYEDDRHGGHDGRDEAEYGGRDEDRSGSNSGRH